MEIVEHDVGPVNGEGSGEGAPASVAGGGAIEAVGPTATGAADEGEEGTSADRIDDGPDDGSGVRDPLRFNNWMKRSATGAVMTGIAVGLQQALQLPRQEPAFVIEASGEPHDPNRAIDLHFDPDNPADTVAIVRRPAPVDPPEKPSPPA